MWGHMHIAGTGGYRLKNIKAKLKDMGDRMRYPNKTKLKKKRQDGERAIFKQIIDKEKKKTM